MLSDKAKELMNTPEGKELADSYIQSLIDNGVLRVGIVNNQALWDKFKALNTLTPVYEVVAYRYKGIDYSHNKDKIYSKREGCSYEGNYYYTNNDLVSKAYVENYSAEYEIYSIKTNDGTIFTVGDTVCWNCKEKLVIDSIFLNPYGGKLTISGNKSDWEYDLEQMLTCNGLFNFQHYKEPAVLFTTEDGYKVEKDLHLVLYYTNIKTLDKGWCSVKDFLGISDGESDYKYWISKEKRDDYVLRNKKLFSVEDIELMDLSLDEEDDLSINKGELLSKAKELNK